LESLRDDTRLGGEEVFGFFVAQRFKREVLNSSSSRLGRLDEGTRSCAKDFMDKFIISPLNIIRACIFWFRFSVHF
jgi:hypothetical protein